MHISKETKLFIKLQHLERKPHRPQLVFMLVLYPGQIGISSLGFSGGRKTGEPREKPSEQGENQQQTQPTYGTRPEPNPGHTGGRPALSPLHRPCSTKGLTKVLIIHLLSSDWLRGMQSHLQSHELKNVFIAPINVLSIIAKK